MTNKIVFQGLNPLSIRGVGTGDYVKRECEHLVDLFDLVKFEEEQSMRNDMEELIRDNYFDR